MKNFKPGQLFQIKPTANPHHWSAFNVYQVCGSLETDMTTKGSVSVNRGESALGLVISSRIFYEGNLVEIFLFRSGHERHHGFFWGENEDETTTLL